MVGDQPFHDALLWSRTGEVIDPTTAAPSDSGSGRYDDTDIGSLISFIRSNGPDGLVLIVETTTVSKALYLARLSLSDDHKLPRVEGTN